MKLEDYLYKNIKQLILNIDEPDVYAISLVVEAEWSNEYEPENLRFFPTFVFGYNTETKLTDRLYRGEKRVDIYPKYPMKSTTLISCFDTVTVPLLLQWYKDNNVIGIGTYDTSNDYDENMNYIGKGPNGLYELMMLASDIARKLQLEGVVKQKFGKIPIIVQDTRWIWYVEDATKNANPNGEADEFLIAFQDLKKGFVPQEDFSKYSQKEALARVYKIMDDFLTDAEDFEKEASSSPSKELLVHASKEPKKPKEITKRVSKKQRRLKMKLEDYLYTQCKQTILDIDDDNVYAVAFLVTANYNAEYQGIRNFPSLAVSYNVESKSCNMSKYSEERWNYAYWDQDEVDIVSPYDENSAQLLMDWFAENGITDIGAEDEENDYDEDMNYIGKGPKGYYEFLMLVSKVARRLQLEGVVKEKFGEIPLLVEDLELAWYVEDATANANPNGEAKNFLKFLDEFSGY